MKIKYLLKKRGTSGAAFLIYCALYSGDDTEIIYTGQRTAKKDWSKSERLPKDQKGDVFKAIEKVKGSIVQAMRRLEADERPVTPYTVKAEYEQMTEAKGDAQRQADKRSKTSTVTITKLVAQWLRSELFRFKTSSQKSITESLNAFTEYLKKVGLATLERKELTREIISGYERYLLEKKKLSDNTHGKRIKHLRWFLKTLEPLPFDPKSIKIRSSKKSIISLTIEELEKLEAVDASGFAEWQKAKDLFLLGCYTGLRVSDLKRLNKINTQNGMITLTLQKNNKSVRIPIVQECKRILERYDYHAPKLSEQALNENIKEVCEKAGISAVVSVDETKGGKRISKNVVKHKLITSHIAGKTFITLAPSKWGLTPAEIAAIVGKDLKTLTGHYFNEQGDEARKKIIEIDSRSKMIADK
jgi:integrase